MDLIVVGTGLFGSVLGRWAAMQGLKVMYVDSQDYRSASKASGGLFKPDWLGALGGKSERQAAMDLIESITPFKKVGLMAWPTERIIQLLTVSPDDLCVREDHPSAHVVRARVLRVSPGRVHVSDQPEGTEVTQIYEAKYVVVAAGVGINDILFDVEVPTVDAKAGMSFMWKRRPGNRAEVSALKVWAPYKQTIVFERDKGYWWGGDGTALIPKNATDERWEACAHRVGDLARWADKRPVVHKLYGHRPLVSGHKKGLLHTVTEGNVWLMTGGGKIGTVAAGGLTIEWAQQVGL